MDIGLFLPNVQNGYIASSTSPQYEPTFELMHEIVRTAEDHKLDFALAIVKLRNHDSASGHWNQALESFTLTAALAARTERIKLYASTAVLGLNPAVAARMATTLESIAPGRIGINIVAGSEYPEYDSIGALPGMEYLQDRYERAAEYVEIMRALWETGECTLDGKFNKMKGARVGPLEQSPDVVCAGMSDRGLDFTAQHGDIAMVAGWGVNDPQSVVPTMERAKAAMERHGRKLRVYALLMVIADETDEAAWAKWHRYEEGADPSVLAVDTEFVNTVKTHSEQDKTQPGTEHGVSSALAANVKDGMLPINDGLLTFIGSYAHVAEMLDQVAEAGIDGVLISFDDYVKGTADFGQYIQPLMACRTDRLVAS